MTAFVNQHYRTAFPAAKLRTAAPAVTNKWLTEPTTFSPEVYRLYASARLGILPVNANRQPRANNPRRNCLHCSVLETPTHIYSSCPRYMNQRRMRHDNAITAALPHLQSATAATTQGLRVTRTVRTRMALPRSVVAMARNATRGARRKATTTGGWW